MYMSGSHWGYTLATVVASDRSKDLSKSAVLSTERQDLFRIDTGAITCFADLGVPGFPVLSGGLKNPVAANCIYWEMTALSGWPGEELNRHHDSGCPRYATGHI